MLEGPVGVGACGCDGVAGAAFSAWFSLAQQPDAEGSGGWVRDGGLSSIRHDP